jgi:hypothetical protein
MPGACPPPFPRGRRLTAGCGARLVAAALGKDKIHAWDFPSFRDASREYVRNSMDLDDFEARARFPAIVRR